MDSVCGTSLQADKAKGNRGVNLLLNEVEPARGANLKLKVQANNVDDYISLQAYSLWPIKTVKRSRFKLIP